MAHPAVEVPVDVEDTEARERNIHGLGSNVVHLHGVEYKENSPEVHAEAAISTVINLAAKRRKIHDEIKNIFQNLSPAARIDFMRVLGETDPGAPQNLKEYEPNNLFELVTDIMDDLTPVQAGLPVEEKEALEDAFDRQRHPSRERTFHLDPEIY